jgi:5'-deoxynucleotidase YfbR-like HD superfamily hydrolase
MNYEDSGDFIYTYTGRKFYATNPRVCDIELEDIIWALSKICRFGNHCHMHYSVAQHSVLASYLVPEHLALTTLMHDASEAYMGDIVRPLKRYPELAKVVEGIERRISIAISKMYGLVYPLPPEVIKADNIMLFTEKRDVMHHIDQSVQWVAEEKYEKLRFTIRPCSESKARQMFRNRFYELYNKP